MNKSPSGIQREFLKNSIRKHVPEEVLHMLVGDKPVSWLVKSELESVFELWFEMDARVLAPTDYNPND